MTTIKCLQSSSLRRHLHNNITRTACRCGEIRKFNVLNKIFPCTTAEIQQRRCLSTTQLKPTIRWVPQNSKPEHVAGYFVTLPNIPNETPENNHFLETIAENRKWPPLESATPDEMYEGTVKLILEYGASVWEQMDLLESDAKRAAKGHTDVTKRTFDNTVYSLLTEEYDMCYAVYTLFVKMLTNWPDCHPELFREDLYQIEKTFTRELSERWTEETWIEAVKQAYENDADKLEQWQKRYLEWMMLQAHLGGYITIPKGDKKAQKQREINYAWNRHTQIFSMRYIGLLTQDPGVKIGINHRYLLKHAPPRALELLSKGSNPDEGPWEAASTSYASLFAALRYCSARELRQELWQGYVSRNSFTSERLDLNNSVHIEELRHNTEGFAKALGFKSTAHHRISSKMAGSPQTVRTFVDELLRHFRPVFLDRMEGAWKNFGQEEEERVISDLQAFDLYYICRREAEHRHKTDMLQLMKHFPVWPSFERILKMSSTLFDIEFNDVSNDATLERCHPSVRIFDVTDKTTKERIGYLYVDLFARESKRLRRWTVFLGRPSNEIRGLDKLVYLLGTQPETGPRSLLHYDELGEMLSTFGRALQLLFSRSPCHHLAMPTAPYYASDFDANDFLPSFMKFCMYKPQLLEALSSPNVQTGQLLDMQLAQNYAQALQRSTFWESYRTLFWTDFDLTIHNMTDWKKKFWRDLYRQMYSEYFPSFVERTNFQPCSFTSVFGLPSYAGLYYRKLWAEMLALDVHGTFAKEGNEAATGQRLRTEWLNEGSLELQSELYRKFQGREPSMDGIINFYCPQSLESEQLSEKMEEERQEEDSRRVDSQ